MTDSKKNKVVSLSGVRDKEKSVKTRDKEKSAKIIEKQEPVICSFCGRPNHMVIKMVKGPSVNICSECVMICVQYFIMEDRLPSNEAQKVLDAFWRESKK